MLKFKQTDLSSKLALYLDGKLKSHNSSFHSNTGQSILQVNKLRCPRVSETFVEASKQKNICAYKPTLRLQIWAEKIFISKNDAAVFKIVVLNLKQ